MKNSRDAIDFSKEPVKKVFQRMFLPTLIGMVSMVILNISDGAFVGHGVGAEALAAVNIVAPMFMISGGLALMFGIGASVVASIHLAKGNTHAANLNITQGIAASVASGIVIAVLTLCFQRETCLLFGCSEQLVPLACSYLKWIAIVTPSNMLGMTAMFAVRLDGKPRFAMVMNCGMALSNIVLDYLLIFPCQWGLEGAAIATCTAFGLGNIPLLWFMFTRLETIRLCRIKASATSLRLSLRNIGYQMKIGVSALIGELALATIMIVGNYMFIEYLGEDGVAAFSIACYCLPIVFMIGNAIVQSIQPVISFAHGNRDIQRMYEALRIALLTALVTGLAGMSLMMFAADVVAGIFLPTDCHAFEICLQGLPLYSSAFLFIAVNIVMVGFLQSSEAAFMASVYTLLRGFILSIPAFICLPLLLGATGLWIALPTAELLTLVIMVAVIKLTSQ